MNAIENRSLSGATLPPKKPSVLHIVQADDPAVGGSLVVAQALVAEQRKLGWDANLCFLYGECPTPTLGSTALSRLRQTLRRRSQWLLGPRKLKSTIARFQPDIIHHHDGILWPRLATWSYRSRIVTHGHLAAPSAGAPRSAKLTHTAIVRSTARLVAISNWVAESWRASGFPDERIRTIGNGVDTDRFFARTVQEKSELRDRLGVPEGRIVLLWAGRLHRQTKGLDRLLEIGGIRDPRFHVVVVGDGQDRDWLVSQLQLKATACNFDLVGRKANLEEWFAAADAFLFTSRVEPFGLVLLEAAASALPILSLPCEGGANELLPTLAGLPVQDMSANELINTLRGRRESGIDLELSRIVRERFSWQECARAVVAVYEELVLDKYVAAGSRAVERVAVTMKA
jgi:glycosyltransferase involved in cell wall biosynthesis